MKRKNKNTKFMKFIDAVTSKSLKALMITIPLNIAMYSIDITAQDVYAQIDRNVGIEIVAPEEEVPERAKSDIEYIIQILTEEYDFSAREVSEALEIIGCESGYDPYAFNYNASSNSLDRGYFQINSKYQPHVTPLCAYDTFCATRAAAEIYKSRQNWSAWACAKILNL